MKNLIHAICYSVLFALIFPNGANAARQAPPFGDSLDWNTGSESPSLDALAGKSVLNHVLPKLVPNLQRMVG